MAPTQRVLKKILTGMDSHMRVQSGRTIEAFPAYLALNKPSLYLQLQ